MVSLLNARYSSTLSDIDVIDWDTAVTLILPKIECGASWFYQFNHVVRTCQDLITVKGFTAIERGL